MKKKVTIPADEYQELLRKAAAYDSVVAELEAVTEERDLLKANLEESEAHSQEVTDYCKKLEAALTEEQKKSQDLDNQNKNLREQIASLKSGKFGGGPTPSKKEQENFELRNMPGLFDEYEDEQIAATANHLIDLVEESRKECEGARGELAAQEAQPNPTPKKKRKTAEERERELKEKYGNLPVKEEMLMPVLPEGTDLSDYIQIGVDSMDILCKNPSSSYIKRIMRPKLILRPKQSVSSSENPVQEDNDEQSANDQCGTLPVRAQSDDPSEDDLHTTVYQAPMPALPFPRAHVSADFISWVIVSKFMFSLPEYRQIRMLWQEGVTWLSTSTLNDWVRYAAEKLYPLYLQQRKFIMESDYVQGDEVPLKIADKKGKKARNGACFQVHDASERRGGCVFIYEAGSRKKDVAEKIYTDFNAAAQFDDYAGYHWLRDKPGVTVLACLAHILRKFKESLKVHKEEKNRLFIDGIQQMYRIDHILAEMKADYDTIKKTRIEKTLPIFENVISLARQIICKTRPGSSFCKALGYMLKNEDGIRNVFKDGRYLWDNNLCEIRNRTVTIGRKNYLFAKNDDKGENLAIFYTFTETLMELNVTAQEYLEHVLTLPLETMKPEELRNELPYFYGKRLKEAGEKQIQTL